MTPFFRHICHFSMANLVGYGCAIFVAALFSATNSTASEGDVVHLKTIQIPGNLIDKSNLQEPLGPGLWHDLFGGISAMEYLGRDDLYLALPDRGPLDGAVEWTCRIQVLQLSPSPTSQLDFRLMETTLLLDGERKFSGLATRYAQSETKTKRFDPEGIRIDQNGRVFVTDEYGPQLLEFSFDGALVKKHPIPERLLIANPGPNKAEENAANETGRQSNRGMEGLALSTDGSKLMGLMQSPLLQDSENGPKGKPTGLNCRLIEFDIASGRSREFLYPLDKPGNKLNEILAINDQEFLVIERDGKIGNDAAFKKIMKINLSQATEIQSIEKLPPMELPDGVVPVEKQDFIDLLDPRFGLSGSSMPEKIESLTFGPNLEDGRRTLLVASDNDFITNQPTLIYCFALGDSKSEVTRKTNNKTNSISKR